MEDRATCRISTQYVANWLLHGLVTTDQVEASLPKVAHIVDGQNAHEADHPMTSEDFTGPVFRAVHELVFSGTALPLRLHRARPAPLAAAPESVTLTHSTACGLAIIVACARGS